MKVKDRRVLILNATYEPMGTIDVQDAICKMFSEHPTLEVVAWDDEVKLRSTHSEWRVPSIMRLNYYVPLRKKRDQSLSKRGRIYQRDKFKCQYCGTRVGKIHPITKKKLVIDDLTLDHIQPKSRDGETKPWNLVTACLKCNQIKKDRTPEEAGMKLLISPTLLKLNLDRVGIMVMAEKNPQWKQYLFMDNSGDANLQHTGDHNDL